MRLLVRLIYVIAGSIGIFWWLANDSQRDAMLKLAGFKAPAPPPGRVEPKVPLPELTPAPIARVEAFRKTGCKAPTRDTSETVQPVMYRWQDDGGRTVYGDRAPSGVDAEPIGQRYRAAEQFVQLEFIDHGQRYGAQLRSVIGTDVEAMSRILRSGLDLDVRQIDLKITLVSSDAALREGASKTSASMPDLAGYYQHGANAVTLKEQRSLDATRRVARHEASHAMLAGMFGSTPLWLNEGLAEMMESLDLAGQHRTAQVHQRHVKALDNQFRAFDARALPALLAISQEQWGAQTAEFTYAWAWSLVHMLMSSRQGQAFVNAVLDAQLDRPCQPLDSLQLADAHYPGGATALARDWQNHIRQELWRPVRF